MPESDNGASSAQTSEHIGIYLAGPVEQTDDPRSWRDHVKGSWPDLEFLDPMEWQQTWDEDPQAVIEKELTVCETQPILVCNIGADGPRTVGTHHEISHALAHGNDRIAAVCKGEPAGFIEHRPIQMFERIADAIDWLAAPSTEVRADD